MTRSSAYFLTQLKNFLDANGAAKRRELQKLHVKLADGKKIHTVNISRHVNLRMAPLIDTVIVYLRFAQVNGIIAADPSGHHLFQYVNAKTPAKVAKKSPKKA